MGAGKLGQEGPGGVRGADEVDVHDAPPQVGVGHTERPAGGDPRVGDDHGRRAEPIGHRPCGGVEGVLVGDVGLDAQAGRGQGRGRRVQGACLTAHECDVHAGLRQAPRQGFADAAGGAGDDGDTASQPRVGGVRAGRGRACGAVHGRARFRAVRGLGRALPPTTRAGDSHGVPGTRVVVPHPAGLIRCVPAPPRPVRLRTGHPAASR
ncbi:hypothetical protein GCM10020256_74030 [Streptomyces thermocoprophilus]